MSEGRSIRQFLATALEGQVSTVTRAVSLRALSGVVLRTPVDTGRARGNWQVNLGAATGAEVDVEDKGGASTISKGSATIAAQQGYQQVVLENNVPYIGRLEDGYSKQAPTGMAGETIATLGLSGGREE